MYIHQLDTLVDTVYHVLSQSHTSACTCAFLWMINLDLGMFIYNAHFQHSCLTYSDLSVCSILPMQALHISSSCTGVAASAGELVKDQRH